MGFHKIKLNLTMLTQYHDLLICVFLNFLELELTVVSSE